MLAPHQKQMLNKWHSSNQASGQNQSAGDTGNRPKKIWATLITNTNYLAGLLTLDFALKKVGSKYALVALYTDQFPPEGLAALKARGILSQRIEYLSPSVKKDYSDDPRFYDCWSKLAPFGLTEYDRIVLLDSDMLVLKNMDELMEMELDPPETAGEGNKVYAASHACACNPLKKKHYPKGWTPENCAFTSQHDRPDEAQKMGCPATAGVASPNSGLVVLNPSKGVYDKIVETLQDGDLTAKYDFPDQDLLGDQFHGRWVGLPYIYNALKTLRWKGVHDAIWRDEEVKNVHYILSPKPWDDTLDTIKDETHRWWLETNAERLSDEKSRGIDDGF